MDHFFQYILKLSICLAVVYIVYFILLRRLTFYTWNRWYLLLFSILSFVFPLINISEIFDQSNHQSSNAIDIIPSIYNYGLFDKTQSGVLNISSFQYIAFLLFCVGTLFLTIKLFIQVLSFRKLKRSANLVVDDLVKVYHVNEKIVPFSFANAIFINEGQHEQNELKEIIRHEFIHVRQKHSIDILFAEILFVLNWYNPFVWLIRHSIRQNLEFIADEQVISQGFDSKQYQYLLLKVIGVRQFSIASSFNFISLKKRIAMMNKNKSAKVNLSRFLVLVPLIAILLLAFRKEQQQNFPDQPIPSTDTIPKKSTIVLPEHIQSVDVNKNENKITIKLKSGIVERFDLNNEKERKAFEEKYGLIQEPPAPPAPPVPPVPVTAPSPVPDAPPAPGVPPTPPVPPSAPKKNVTHTTPKISISIRNSRDSSGKSDASLDEPSNPGKSRFTTFKNDPLYIINGKEMPLGSDLTKMDPNQIESISVLKDQSATAAYGDKGKNGVILITTKKGVESRTPSKKDSL